MAGARSALRDLTSSRLSERSERSSRSELATRPWERVPQGSRQSRPPRRSVAGCAGPALPCRRVEVIGAFRRIAVDPKLPSKAGAGAAGGPLPGLRMRRPVLRPGSPAMLGLVTPSQNSLRELRSLRSNNCDETEHEARCARGPRALRFSASHRRPGGDPPAALDSMGCSRSKLPARGAAFAGAANPTAVSGRGWRGSESGK